MSGPLRVLVIDDDAADREAVLRAIREDAPKLTATTAETLGAGLDHLGARQYDVIVLDLGLPDVSGSSASTVARVAAAARGARLLVLTGAAGVDTVWACYEAGADGLALKGDEDPCLPALGAHVQGQALAARRARRIAAAVGALAPTTTGRWWSGLPAVQRGALAVAAVGAAVQLAVAVLERVVQPLLAWAL